MCVHCERISGANNRIYFKVNRIFQVEAYGTAIRDRSHFFRVQILFLTTMIHKC